MNAPLKPPTSMKLQTLRGWRKAAAMPSVLPDCAVIVPTYRRRTELLRLLNVVASFPHLPAEFFVIDGSPNDEVNRALQKWALKRALPFDLIYVNSPPGLTCQRNVGLDACEKEFIFFLDDDSVPGPDYFAAVRNIFAEDISQDVGAVRGFLTNPVNQPITPLWRLRYGLRIVPRGQPGQYHHCGTSGTWNGVAPFSGTREIDILVGCAATYRREVFLQHRFSDFFHGYSQGEDLEMSLRIRQDWKVLLCGDAHLEHREAPNGRPAGFARGRMVLRNRYFIWKRHSPNPGFVSSLRFWADHLLTILFYSTCFLVRPWRPYYFAYAIGTAFGWIECLISPPHHQERPIRKEFTFRLDELSSVLVSEEVA